MEHIAQYADFFHDGAVMDIQHVGTTITLSIASAEVDEDDIIFARTNKNDPSNDIPLSEDDSIQGRLHIEGVKKITINDKPLQGQLTMEFDSGRILDFEIEEKKVGIGVRWDNFPPKPNLLQDEYTYAIIEANKIWWENIPNLEDQYL